MDECTRHVQVDILDERLAWIEKTADALTDFLGGEGWALAYGIKKVAKGEWTPSGATRFIDGREGN